MKKAKRKRNKKESWTSKEFVDSVWGTMKDQAKKNPALHMTHARFEPEWNKVVQKIALLLEAQDDATLTKYTEEICKYGARAVRPLIDALLRLRSSVLMEDSSCGERHDINE